MKILIASVSTGAGHMRAAEAVQCAFQIAHPGVKVLHVNAMNYVSKTFRKIYEDGYSFMVNRTPALWGSVYGMTDHKNSENSALQILNSFQSRHAAPFFDCIERFSPDRILTTHFFIPQILSQHNRETRLRIPLECVITDFDLHQSWVDENIAHYYVAREKISIKLQRSGVPKEKITVSGIPIHPDFLKEAKRDTVLSKLGLRPERPTLLLLSGGLGFGAMEATVKKLFSIPTPMQIITVSGKNEEKKKILDSLKPPTHISLVNLGFANNMHELVAGADMVVTKAGGLTLSENIARGAATIIFGAIPGQEEKNAAYIKMKGAGIQVETLDELARKVHAFIEIPEALERLRCNARMCAKPFAAFTVADTMLHHMKSCTFTI